MNYNNKEGFIEVYRSRDGNVRVCSCRSNKRIYSKLLPEIQTTCKDSPFVFYFFPQLESSLQTHGIDRRISHEEIVNLFGITLYHNHDSRSHGKIKIYPHSLKSVHLKEFFSENWKPPRQLIKFYLYEQNKNFRHQCLEIFGNHIIDQVQIDCLVSWYLPMRTGIYILSLSSNSDVTVYMTLSETGIYDNDNDTYFNINMVVDKHNIYTSGEYYFSAIITNRICTLFNSTLKYHNDTSCVVIQYCPEKQIVRNCLYKLKIPLYDINLSEIILSYLI
jgi:hypothetical protein